MRKMAEKQLGVPINKAIISVPAEFDERQRNYTIRAANLAGQFTTHFLKCHETLPCFNLVIHTSELKKTQEMGV